MAYVRTILSAIVAGMILAAAPSLLWAESAAPTGAFSDFLAGVNCPDPTVSTGCFDPNASGTKFSGTLTVVYATRGVVSVDGCGTGTPFFVKNGYVNLTLQQGDSSAPFTADYVGGVNGYNIPGYCGPVDNDNVLQADVIVELISVKVIPSFYPSLCTGRVSGQAPCPDYKIKSATNYQFTAGDLHTPDSYGFSVDITIAVH